MSQTEGIFFSFKRGLEKVKSVLSRIYVNTSTFKFINHNRKLWENNIEGAAMQSTILLELNDLPSYIITWSYAANILSKKFNAKICTYEDIPRRIPIPNYRLRKIFDSINAREHIVVRLTPEDAVKRDKAFQEIINNVQSKQDWKSITFHGFNIGIDIYEHYLRAANKPTLDLGDPLLKELLLSAITKVLFWEKNIIKLNVCAVFVTHDCYLSNVIRRVANKYQIPVYEMGIQWGIKLNDENSRWGNYPYYHDMFLQLSDEQRKKGVSWAKHQLARRFDGEVGVDMSYSKKSSFGEIDDKKVALKKSKNIKILICTHCFFDNINAYGSMFFVDYYEWLCYLGELAEKTSYDWYIKPHPDYRPGTLETLHEIIARYPKLVLLPPETSHKQLAYEGIDCVLTVHGTVGCEYPLLGVPVINAGNNPHIAYDFCCTPKDIAEYRDILLNLATLLPVLKNKIVYDDVYEFYFIHHIYANYCSYYRINPNLIFQASKELSMTSDTYTAFLQEWNPERHKTIVNNVCRYIEQMDAYKIGKIDSIDIFQYHLK